VLASLFMYGSVPDDHAIFSGTARVVSLFVTGVLMALLGVARGLIGHVNIWCTAVQTMAIAGAAALAGVVIGRLVSA
jgi:VIT1/CCC1 family predicted Fe2+/Mn2+ transporter